MAAKLQFKFRDETSKPEREQLILKLEDNGASEVTRLFPDALDGLGGVYSLQVHGQRMPKLLDLLKRSRLIEFAEPAVERRLIMPR